MTPLLTEVIINAIVIHHFRPPPSQHEEEPPPAKTEEPAPPPAEVIPAEEQAELVRIEKLLSKAQIARNTHRKIVSHHVLMKVFNCKKLS